MSIIFLSIKIIFNSFLQKKNWKKPQLKKIVIYDLYNSEFISLYLKKSDFVVFHNRFDEHFKINFYLVFFLIIRLKLNFKNYKYTFIKFTNPKFIITAIDYNPGFYELKNKFPNIKTILFQFSYKFADGGIFEKKTLRNLVKNKKMYKVDHIFVFNRFFKKMFKKFLLGNYHIIGSFFNNVHNYNYKKKKINYLYISKGSKYTDKNFQNFFLEEIKLLKNLSNYLFKKGEILTIAGKSFNNLEKIFFKNFCEEKKKIHFIKRNVNRMNTYKLLHQAKIILGTDSTMLYEGLSKGLKVCIFRVRKKYHLSRKFGWPAYYKEKGRFWTHSYSLNEIERVISYINKIKKNDLINYLEKINFFNNVLYYDKGNKKFIMVAKKIGLIN